MQRFRKSLLPNTLAEVHALQQIILPIEFAHYVHAVKTQAS